jgi:hypothetical protein
MRVLLMLAFYVDYNARERLPGGGQAVSIALGKMNPAILGERLAVGVHVILYDEETKCMGVLRHGKYYDWVADIIPETITDLSKADFDSLRVATKRAAIGEVRESEKHTE